jgi:uncharacterized protein YdaU (DUF1376 family)
MHYYQHHIGDFIKATSRLTDSQAMAYLRLIWMYYDSEKPLPNDIEVLALQIGLPIDDVHLLLRAYFRLEDGVWKHSRCDAEIEEYRSFVDKKSRAGKASAEQRKNSSTTSDEQVLNECSTDVQLTNNHKPITNNQEYIDRFDIFWKQYPRKVAKPNALKSWLKIKPDDVVLKKMLDAINQQQLPSKEIQFVPHPATWLNAKRWEDEVATTSSGTYAWFVNDRRIK